MADTDDKVLKGDLNDDDTLVQENPEADFFDGPTEEDLAAAESEILVKGERAKTATDALDTIEKQGDFMTGELTKEHRVATRDKVTGAMKLDFLGADDDEDLEADEPEMPSSEAKLEETPEPANDETPTVSTGWKLPSRDEAVQYTADGASLAYVGAATLSPVDLRQAARLASAGAGWAAKKVEKADWHPKIAKDAASKALDATAKAAKEGVNLAEAAEKRVDDIAERQMKKAA